MKYANGVNGWGFWGGKNVDKKKSGPLGPLLVIYTPLKWKVDNVSYYWLRPVLVWSRDET